MNYYQHHIGDYAAETAYLSLIEDAIYTRLLRVYYRDETPLPNDLAKVAWLIGLRTKKEKAVLAFLLDAFFTQQDDGWHNVRADDEIAKYHDKQGKAKAAIDARWGKVKDAPAEDTDARRGESQPDTSVSQQEYGRNTDVIPTNNHKPLTKNQEPRTTNQKTDSTTGTSPVVPHAQARATQLTSPPVDNLKKPEGFQDALIAKPNENPSVSGKPSGKQSDKALRGSRLPEGWHLPKLWGDWALQERPDLNADDVQREADCFADYWHAKVGTDARKADWEATWRNWIRRTHSKPRISQQHYQPGEHIDPSKPIALVRNTTMQSAEIAKQLIFSRSVPSENEESSHAAV